VDIGYVGIGMGITGIILAIIALLKRRKN